MMKRIKPNWCNWPYPGYKRDINDLAKVGARCDAWRSFFESPAHAKLQKVKAHVIYFNKYEYFDKLICEFDCSEKKLRNIIESLMRPGHEAPVNFVRKDIYDARAWSYLPLTCFVEINGCNERSGKRLWQWEVLEHNEVPIIQFGIRLPWIVSRSCFTLTHRLKHGARYAVMTFYHDLIDSRFNGKRWVGEEMFPREATRKEMMEHLFAKVEKECAKHLVTIEELP